MSRAGSTAPACLDARAPMGSSWCEVRCRAGDARQSLRRHQRAAPDGASTARTRSKPSRQRVRQRAAPRPCDSGRRATPPAASGEVNRITAGHGRRRSVPLTGIGGDLGVLLSNSTARAGERGPVPALCPARFGEGHDPGLRVPLPNSVHRPVARAVVDHPDLAPPDRRGRDCRDGRRDVALVQLSTMTATSAGTSGRGPVRRPAGEAGRCTPEALAGGVGGAE
jgi:hypothetical protein